mmetsp:Transcript_347/g.1008  ORF Transcript_347/g.1008 Transcript_347/m.1008 type:complete len:388 (-) Transcript_347:53-1216(-)
MILVNMPHRIPILFLAVLSSCSAFITQPADPNRNLQLLRNKPLSATASSSSSSDAVPASAATSSSSLDRQPTKGDIVTVNWNLEPRADFVAEPLFDTTGQISFVLHGGNYLPGLHELVAAMKPGDAVENTVLDAGWGERRDDLVVKMPKQDNLDMSKINVGTELMLANGLKCVVTEVGEEDFTIDANPPLAGASYSANVTLVSVEEGPTQLLYREDGNEDDRQTGRYGVATFALGCFWGGELEFMRVAGVVGTKVGYTQGEKEKPTYNEVCSGTTGHTEAIQVVFDPSVVSFEKLVHIAMDRLDDSKYMLNQVGNDRGTQYRHEIYYHTSEQREIAREVLNTFGEHCKTELEQATMFYDGEDYHQQYLLKGGQSAKKGDDTTIRCYG